MTGRSTADDPEADQARVTGPPPVVDPWLPTSEPPTPASPWTCYLDSSALVKLVIDEAESEALDGHVESGPWVITSSALARVEVMRAVRVAQVGEEASTEAGRQLASWRLVGVTDGILREAARLASLRLRSLDAIHLATALLVQPVEFITYDERLADAARDQGLHVIQPGLTPAVGDHPRPRRDRRLHDRDA